MIESSLSASSLAWTVRTLNGVELRAISVHILLSGMGGELCFPSEIWGELPWGVTLASISDRRNDGGAPT
jgi:hypothetical protein